MKILYLPDEIQKALIQVKPTKIAVAYIGKDFENYIDITVVEKIIVSPTVGSNPNSIGKLKDLIGWDKLLFMKNLHAKIYIGSEHAIIGSANLTNNALGQKGLLEVCMLINKKDDLELFLNLELVFRDIKDKADKYNTHEKNELLEELHVKWRKPFHFFSESSIEPAIFSNYSVAKNGVFYPVWYDGERDESNSESYETEMGEDWESIIENEIDVSAEDIKTITAGNWVLTWKRKNDTMAYKQVNPAWLFVHKVIKNASEDKDYPHALVQVNNEKTPPIPFEIDVKFKAIFNVVINRDEFKAFRDQGNEGIWQTNKTKNHFHGFIESLKAHYNNT